MYEKLVGSWRLRAMRIEMQGSGEILEPWGARPDGWLILTPEGRLMTITAREGRGKLQLI